MDERVLALSLALETEIKEDDLIAELLEAVEDRLAQLGADVGFIGLSPSD